MLNIEVYEVEQHGHTNYEHTVVVEDDITSAMAEDFQTTITIDDDVIIAWARIEPGEEIPDTDGVIAEYYQFSFVAKLDMSEWLQEKADDLFAPHYQANN